MRYQSLHNTMFDALKPQLEAMGVKPAEDWLTTKVKIAREARAQLRRKNLRPETTTKWHRLGSLVGA